MKIALTHYGGLMRECWLRGWSPLTIHVIILDTAHQCLDISEYFMVDISEYFSILELTSHIAVHSRVGSEWYILQSYSLVGVCWKFVIR